MALVSLTFGVLLLLTGSGSSAGANIAQSPPTSAPPTAPSTTPSSPPSTTTPSSTVAPGSGASNRTADGRSAVDVIKVDGLLDPVMVSFIRESIAKGNADGAIAVVLTIDSEGAVVSDADLVRLITEMQQSAVPVDVWVGPSNSSATGNAAALLAGARTIGVAPGARIGGAPNVDPTVAGTLEPGSPLTKAGLFGAGARVIGADEAKSLGITSADSPTVLEFLANVPGFETATREVNGRTIREPVTIVRFGQLSLVHLLFHAVAGPSSAYLLLSIGLALFIFELFTAGVGVAGIVGATCFVFGCYGMATLPTHTVSLAALVLAFVALAIDVQTGVPRFWTALGLSLYVLGSLTLFDGVSMSWITLVAGISGMLLAFLSGMPSMVRTRFATPTIGRDWMIGEMGRAITAVSPDGVVQIQGAMWRAFTNRATPIEELDKVRVVGIEGLVLEVEPEEGGARDYRERGPKETAAAAPPAAADTDS